MARKKKVPKGQLGDWLDEVPEDVQDASDNYVKAHTVKTIARGEGH